MLVLLLVSLGAAASGSESKITNESYNLTDKCTTIMIGKDATADGSVLMSSSCDGNIYGLIYLDPAVKYPEGTKLPMYVNYPRPKNYEEYLKQVEEGYNEVGYMSVEETYRSVLVGGYLTDIVDGGINEYGVTMGIEFVGMKPELANTQGVVSPNSNHWTTQLIAVGLKRAKSAREAIQIMGAMVEEFGFQYYWVPTAGCMIPVADKNEAWMMEIVGPGEDWTPDSNEPGGVWVAQRIPDGEVAVNANRCIIGEIDLNNSDFFMASPNIYSTAEKLGFWKPGEPFIWYEVYGVPGSRYNYSREWAALNILAPSLNLQFTGDPIIDRYPFSVKPDKLVTVEDCLNIMRDYYEGTELDITENPAFYINGEKSPLARPWGPPELFKLLGITPERCIGSQSTSYVLISQLRNWLPDPIAGCMWFAYGPAYTSVFAPIYSGVTSLPESWEGTTDFLKINREQTHWLFQLVHNLSYIKYQEAIKDIKAVYEPAEANFLAIQNDFEKTAVDVFNKDVVASAENFVTKYTNSCLNQVHDGYSALVDYLMFKYLFLYPDVAQPTIPKIASPVIPDLNN